MRERCDICGIRITPGDGPALCTTCAPAYDQALEASLKVIDDFLAAMPPGTIFPVTKGLITRIKNGIQALKPHTTK